MKTSLNLKENEPKRHQPRVERRYVCSECGSQYSNLTDARKCCAGWQCGICNRHYNAKDIAAKCCMICEACGAAHKKKV